MIYSNEGHCHINGDTATILAELTHAINSVKESLEERYDEDFVREQIANCGRRAYMTADELKEETALQMKELSERLGIDADALEGIISSIVSEETEKEE